MEKQLKPKENSAFNIKEFNTFRPQQNTHNANFEKLGSLKRAWLYFPDSEKPIIRHRVGMQDEGVREGAMHFLCKIETMGGCRPASWLAGWLAGWPINNYQ